MFVGELKRIIDLLEEVAGTDIPIRHIIENVMMDSGPEDMISKELRLWSPYKKSRWLSLCVPPRQALLDQLYHHPGQRRNLA